MICEDCIKNSSYCPGVDQDGGHFTEIIIQCKSCGLDYWFTTYDTVESEEEMEVKILEHHDRK